MGLTNTLFKKELYNLTISDLEEYFAIEQSETSLLEFKSGDVEIDKINREVCAFLNTEGGLLIIGAPREQKGGSGTCTGSLTPTTKYKSVDSIIQSLATGISPSPIGIKGKHLDTGNGMIHILEIAQSINPPHQVSNEGKYYIRFERQAKPAPHGIVEALFNKRQKPLLDLQVAVDTNNIHPSVLCFNIEITNRSSVSADYPSYVIDINGKLNVFDPKNTKPIITKDGVSIHNPTHNIPLVLGLKIQFNLELNVFSKYLFIKGYCWARDTSLVTVAGIFDTTKLKFTKEYLSKRTDNQFSLEEIIDEYDRKKDSIDFRGHSRR